MGKGDIGEEAAQKFDGVFSWFKNKNKKSDASNLRTAQEETKIVVLKTKQRMPKLPNKRKSMRFLIK